MKILLLMIFLHIIDDYCLQGILAQMKQKKFWEDNAPDELYKHDYIWALIMHSFSWTFMILLPFFVAGTVGWLYYVVFVGNLIIHAVIDDLKANKHRINLWADQQIHLVQIIVSFCLLNFYC